MILYPSPSGGSVHKMMEYKMMGQAGAGQERPVTERRLHLRPNGPPQPSPGLSAAMPWEYRHPTNQRPEGARETSSRCVADVYSQTPSAPNPSLAPSGRAQLFASVPQGIVLTHSTLGWVLTAFQAAMRAAGEIRMLNLLRPAAFPNPVVILWRAFATTLKISASRHVSSLFPFFLFSILSTPSAPAAPPTVTTPELRGLQIGKTTPFTLTGTDLLPNPRLLTTARIAKQTLKDGAKPDRITLDIELAPGTQPGLHNWWLVTDGGVSAKGVLAIDSLPQQPFSDKPGAPPVTLPVALHGTLFGSQVRDVTFTARAGQEIICEVEAQRLDSKLRPVLKLFGPDGALLKWSLPYLALRGDTRLETKLPTDGDYRLQLHDLQFAATAPNYFRLKIGRWSYADLAFPSTVQRGVSAEIQLIGRDGEKRTVSLPAGGTGPAIPVPWPDPATASGPQATVWLSDLPELIEDRTNSAPQALPALPVAVNGRISQPGEEDTYTLTVTPESDVDLDVFADSLGSPIDAELELRDLKGARLAINDDANNRPDPRLTYKVPKAVTNLLAIVRDVNGNGGPRCLYRLQATVKAKEKPPAFTLAVLEDSHTLQPGQPGVFKVEAKRDGYDGPIALAFDRLPASVKISGQTIPANATGTLLTLTTDQPLPPLITALTGKAKDLAAPARFASAQLGKFQPWLENDLALAAAPKPDFAFTTAWGQLTPTNSTLALGGKLTLPLTCTRPLGHDGPVRLTLLTSQARLFLNNAVDPARVLREEKAVLIEEDKKAQAAFDALAPATNALAAAQKEAAAAKDEPAKAAAAKKVQAAETALATAKKAAAEAAQKATNTVDFALVIPGELADVPHQLAFRAELLKRDRRTVEAIAYLPPRDFPVLNPLVVKLPAPAPVKLDAKTGASLELTGQIERLAGAKGDVTVTLSNLPAGATAPTTATVKEGATEFKFALKFPATTKPGDFPGLKLSASGKPFAAATVKSRDLEFTVKILPPDPPPVKQAEAKK